MPLESDQVFDEKRALVPNKDGRMKEQPGK